MTKKKMLSIITIIVMAFGVIIPAEASFAGIKTYKSKGQALAKYKVKNYKPVNNKKFTPLRVKNGDRYFYGLYNEPDINYPHLLRTSKGTKNIDLQTLFHLPKAWIYGESGEMDLGNPQALIVTPDGNTAYVTHVTKKKNGCIIKYDLKKMRDLGLDEPGEMNRLRMFGRYPKRYESSDIAKDFRSCVKKGPQFYMGHGNCFAYNPKDKHIWFVTKTKAKKTDLRRINMNTLKPDRCIKYKFAGNVAFGNNITFDKNGRFYFFSYSGSKQGKCPKHAIKIYQGKINLKSKKKKYVTAKLMMNVIKNPIAADHGLQAAGYDPKLNRIIMVSNSAIMSVPVSKLTKKKLRPADVWTTQFNVKREFEDFECDASGNYYLLVNGYAEIMTNKNLEKWGLTDDQFNAKGEYIGEPIE